MPQAPAATMTPIGFVRSVHTDAEAMPSQATADEHPAELVLHEALEPGVLGLDRYEFLWVFAWLDRAAAAGPPPLQLVSRATQATGEVQGVFASRAPQRPNPIALSLVRQTGIAGTVISVAGIDLLDGTPILDIKPWFADCDLPPPSLRPDTGHRREAG